MFVPSIVTGGLTETTIWITGGSTWDVPANWNPNDNTIECIGGGGGGGRLAQAGAGGHYAKISNVNVSGTINVSVGTGGLHQTDGGDTWFGGTDAASALVLAHGGRAGKGSTTVTTSNYDASNSRGDIVFVGGDGGALASEAYGMPGGGGAAGPLGDGGAGGNTPVASGIGFALDGSGGGGANNGQQGNSVTGPNAPGTGGDSGTNGAGGTLETVAGDGGGGVGGRAGSAVVGRGGNGRIWQRTSNGALGGPGGGGGGSNRTAVNGGIGGRFGGGGGSGAGVDGGGVGGDGVIVIKYRHT